MAGTNPAFNAAEFRTNIIATMNMGLPVDPAERATFRWRTETTFDVADPAGNPYDFTSAPVDTDSHVDVQVPCAVEFVSRTIAADGTSLGEFKSPRAVITVLDTHYPDIEGANEVLLGGDAYTINFVAPPLGLFDVTVYQLHCTAVGET